MIFGLTVYTAVLALHIMFVVITFGVIFAFPVIALFGRRMDPSGLPWFHRIQRKIGQTLISPGLLVVIVAGLYLAGKLHTYSAFYVQWGIGVAVVLGGLVGGYLGPRQSNLATLAERDLSAGAGGRGGKLSPEYARLSREVDIVGLVACVLVLVDRLPDDDPDLLSREPPATKTPEAFRPPAGHPRFPGLDGVRALAAIAVLAFHASEFSGAERARWWGPLAGPSWRSACRSSSSSPASSSIDRSSRPRPASRRAPASAGTSGGAYCGSCLPTGWR